MNIRRGIDSVVFKFTILYIFLAIINMSFFVFIIFENQIDLVTDNSRYEAQNLASRIVTGLSEFTNTSLGKDSSQKEPGEVLDEIRTFLKPLIGDYEFFSERGTVIDSSRSLVEITDEDLLAGIKAIASKDFSGKDYLISVDETSYEIDFFIPVKLVPDEDYILHFTLSMGDITSRLNEMYSLVILLVVVIAFLHIFFAILLYLMIVKPITILKEQSHKISEGNFSARIKMRRNDEIGELCDTFNTMAESIEGQIKTIQRQAVTDTLTGLYNRRFLYVRLSEELKKATRIQRGFGVLMIDIDYFKQINDTHGHQTGDIVIAEVAHLLNDTCRESDIICRYGGEEFTVVADSKNLKDTVYLGERIQKAVESVVIKDGDINIKTTVSIGVCFYSTEYLEQIESIDLLLKYPDKALYSAKANGRNRTEFIQLSETLE
jgi:diguanylate cyclase (GGDEF)-like protein